MANTFYVKDLNGKLVEAQYLSVNGSLVLDPNTSIAQSTTIYDSSGNLLSPQDTVGYLIVPASFSVQQGETFGYTLSQENAGSQLLSLYNAFSHGGSQELQRTYDGLTNSTYVPAFTDAASFDFGFVGGFSGISLSEIEVGGGLYNLFSDIEQLFSGHSLLNISGVDFNNPANVNDIVAGYRLGASLKGGFDGDQVALQVYAPDISAADLIASGTATVVPGTTTFPSIAALANGNEPPGIGGTVDSSVTFAGNTITISYPAAGEGQAFASGSFNGFVFQTAANDPAITAVSLTSTNIPGLTADDLSFSGHTISLNEAGLSEPTGEPGSIVITASFATDPMITQSGATIAGDNTEFYNVTGDNLSENIGANNVSPVFISGNGNSLNLLAGSTGSFAITDNGQGTEINLTNLTPSSGVNITINDFQLDPTGSIVLPDQFATPSAAVAALQSDNQGGSILPVGNGATLHFVDDSSITAANFRTSATA